MLTISDLHLTDKKLDEYRWKVFDWVLDYFKKYDDKNLLILGDLTDAKDHHSSFLVNAIVDCLRMLTEAGMEIFILKGNHDYIEPTCPFFKFLNYLEYVNYIVEPKAILIEGETCLFLPHTRDPIGDWKKSKVVRKWMGEANLVFMHQSVIGSVTSNGYRMEEGLSYKYFKKQNVFSGDIHVPQKVGFVEYVGCPYSVRFNDTFKGRALAFSNYPRAHTGVHVLHSNLLKSSLPTGLQSRTTVDIESPDDLQKVEAYPGDQVKVRLHSSRKEIPDEVRQEIQEQCKGLEFQLCSLHLVPKDKFPLRKKRKEQFRTVLTPVQVVSKFSKQTGIERSKLKIGRELVEE